MSLYEVWVNGSAKFEGTLEQCKSFVAKRLAEDPDAEIFIERVENDE